MLLTLDFNITTPTSLRCLERYCKLVKADDLVENLSKYLIEIPLIEYKMLKFSPSMLAAGAVYLSMKILKRENPWNKDLKDETQYTE